MNNVLLPLFRRQHMRHQSCTQLSFFQIIRQNAANDGFWYPCTLPYHPTTSMVVVLQNNCQPSDVFICFHCFSPSTPLCIFKWLLTCRKPAMPSKYHSTRQGWVTEPCYKHFPHFCSCKSRFTTKLYRNKLFNIFSMVIYNTSTENTILQNALTLSHIDELTSNLVCSWKRVLVTTFQTFITIAVLVSIFEAVSKLTGCTLYMIILTNKYLLVSKEHFHILGRILQEPLSRHPDNNRI